MRISDRSSDVCSSDLDDDLHVGQIGNCIERQRAQRVDAGGDSESGADEDQQKIAGRPGDEPGDHGAASGAVMVLSAALRLLSASIRKFAETTTRSPSATPSRISTMPWPRRPIFTSRGSKRPSPRSRITTCRTPVSITALSGTRSEEHTSELQSLMRISYAV